MASPEPPAETPAPEPETGRSGLPLRTLTAWALVAIAALQVLFEFLEWVFPTVEGSGTGRFVVSSFADTTGIIIPAILGLLVGLKLGPAIKNAKLLSTISISALAAATVFALIAFFVRLADHFDLGDADGVIIFGRFLQTVGALLDELLFIGVLALAVLWAIKIAGSHATSLPSVNVDPEDD